MNESADIKVGSRIAVVWGYEPLTGEVEAVTNGRYLVRLPHGLSAIMDQAELLHRKYVLLADQPKKPSVLARIVSFIWGV